MLVAAASSLWAHEIRSWEPWRPIQLLSIFTLAMLSLGIWHSAPPLRAGYRRARVGLFCAALLVASLFSRVPRRIMREVLFGG